MRWTHFHVVIVFKSQSAWMRQWFSEEIVMQCRIYLNQSYSHIKNMFLHDLGAIEEKITLKFHASNFLLFFVILNLLFPYHHHHRFLSLMLSHACKISAQRHLKSIQLLLRGSFKIHEVLQSNSWFLLIFYNLKNFIKITFCCIKPTTLYWIYHIFQSL